MQTAGWLVGGGVRPCGDISSSFFVFKWDLGTAAEDTHLRGVYLLASILYLYCTALHRIVWCISRLCRRENHRSNTRTKICSCYGKYVEHIQPCPASRIYFIQLKELDTLLSRRTVGDAWSTPDWQPFNDMSHKRRTAAARTKTPQQIEVMKGTRFSWMDRINPRKNHSGL